MDDAASGCLGFVVTAPILFLWGYALFADVHASRFLFFLVDLFVPPIGMLHGLLLFL